MSRGKYNMQLRTILSAVLICVPFALQAQFRVQEIASLKETVSLNSIDPAAKGAPPVTHTWWARAVQVDVKAATSTALTQVGDVDRPAEHWTAVPVPGDLHKNLTFMKEWKLTNGVRKYWYRKVFVLPRNIDEQPAVRLGIITDSDRVFLNGVLIGNSGNVESPEPQAYDKIRVYRLPLSALRPGARNVLLVETRNYFPREAGIKQDETLIGPAALIFRQVEDRSFVEIFFLVCYATVGAYFLFLFLRRRRERENLFFALFCLGLVVYQLLRNQLKYETGFEFFLLKRLEYAVLFAMAPAWYYFVRYFFELPRNLVVRMIDWIGHGAALGLLVLEVILWSSRNVVLWDDLNANLVQLVFWPPLILSSLGIMIYRIVRRDRDGLYMALGFVAVLAALVLDILSTRGLVNLPRLLGFGFFSFILAIAGILANRFVRLHSEVEDLNRNLEKKVTDRTQKLRQTLHEVQNLKEQQDGDYFLTALLVHPLSGDHSQSKDVSIEMLTHQKKQFRFREREDEIGGDLNSAHSILLKGRAYTVVLNGDAMGKSMQGAGGALVLGTVFKTIVARTQMSGAAQDVFPEQWLKSAFVELQNTFVAFDGSMLVSIILGLVDDRTGLFYFINAEHPWAVLYRAGRAQFIEEDLALRKVGVEGIEGNLFVKLFQLEPDDALFLGSDGRDDLVVGHEGANRVINEDHTMFLQCVEEGQGNPPRVYEAICKRGEITDDLTLLRVGYREDFPPAAGSAVASGELQSGIAKARRLFRADDYSGAAAEFRRVLDMDPTEETALKELAQTLLKLRDFAGAVVVGERYIDRLPGDTEFLRFLAMAYKHSGDLKAAADSGERVRLREPLQAKNLVQLADTYRLIGNRERAEKLLAEAQRIEPDSESARRLESLLSGSG